MQVIHLGNDKNFLLQTEGTLLEMTVSCVSEPGVACGCGSCLCSPNEKKKEASKPFSRPWIFLYNFGTTHLRKTNSNRALHCKWY